MPTSLRPYAPLLLILLGALLVGVQTNAIALTSWGWLGWFLPVVIALAVSAVTRRGLSLAWFGVLAVVVFNVIFWDSEPIRRNSSHWGRMVIAGVSVLVVLSYAITSGLPEKFREIGKNAVRVAMVTTAVFGICNYYQYDRRVFEGLGDSTDITYYYVNSKYLPELGYFSLYPAMILADRELNDHHSSKIRTYRDLRDYEVKPVSKAYEHGKQIKETQFTPERWEQFKHDVDWFLKTKSLRTMQSNFYVDHGYNPPPTWSVPGSFLANLAPVENVKAIAFVDVYLIGIMFVGIAWAFGFDTMLFALLFYVCTFSGRWPILGEALLRFDWLVCLVLAVCCLKKEKYALAGGLMAYAGLNRIFPLIFFWGWGAVAMYDTIRVKKLLRRHIRFAGGASAVAAVLVVAALVQFGPQTFKDSARNLLMHNRSYSSHRVGLGDLILFRGEKTRKDQRAAVYDLGNGKMLKGIAAKERKVQDMQPLLRLAALGALCFLTVYGWRAKREDVWAMIPLAILPFYCATNPQINYYNLRLLLFLWHGHALATGGKDQFFHRLGMLLLFVGEMATQSAFLTPDPENAKALVARYFVTCTTSVWLAVYFVALIGHLVKDGWFTAREGAKASG